VGGHAFMYMGVRGINIVSYYDLYIGFWNCYDSVVFFVFHFNGEKCRRQNITVVRISIPGVPLGYILLKISII